MNFEFATAARIVFGEGSAQTVAAAARALGARPLLVTGRNPVRTAWLADALRAVVFPVAGEPTVEIARAGAQLALREGCDVVVGCGGGSAIDAGKAIAALAANSAEPLDYLEVVGRGQPLEHLPLPYIAVPTTAGTGAEVTRNAVLGSPAHGVKASLRSPLMLPRLAVVDPELTLELPPAVTAATGLDALTQLIEPYVSVRANPLTDALSVDGIARVAGALRRAWADGSDREARREMALASLLGGLALANAGLGVVHGFAAPIGGGWTAPHGAVCAAVLPHAIRTNLRALRERAPGSAAIERYRTVAVLLTGRADARAEDAIDWLSEICGDLGIPSLRAYGIVAADLAGIAGKAAQASSTKGNPIGLADAELLQIAEGSL
jgi:alcohol dehydrogenase class IV